MRMRSGIWGFDEGPLATGRTGRSLHLGHRQVYLHAR
jgi:hypothetical protein